MLHEKKDGLLGSLLLVTGLVIGAASVMLYKENIPKKPGQVLEEAKQIFRQSGSFEGAWINYEAVEYPSLPGSPLVYIGGFMRFEDPALVQYQFACDVYSGEILDIFPLSVPAITPETTQTSH